MTTGISEVGLESWPELGEQEWQGELELQLGGANEQGELELEFEYSPEGEFEQEQFFGKLAALARTAATSPALRSIGLQAARSVLSGLREQEFEFESEFELESGSGRDGLYSPMRKVYPDALMEHMAHQAASAESEQEAAEAFLPLIPMLAAKLAPLALKALPMVGKVGAKLAPRVLNGVMKVAPQLTKGVGRIARDLFRNKGTRPLLRAVPAIARRTTAQLARQVARGRTVTPQMAVRTLARQTARTLANPRSLVNAYQRGRRLDRAAHRLLPAPRARAGAGAGAGGTRAAGTTRTSAQGVTRVMGPDGVVRQAQCSCGPVAMPPPVQAPVAAPPATTEGCACGRSAGRCPSCGR
jgi:hypothetical protein